LARAATGICPEQGDKTPILIECNFLEEVGAPSRLLRDCWRFFYISAGNIRRSFVGGVLVDRVMATFGLPSRSPPCDVDALLINLTRLAAHLRAKYPADGPLRWGARGIIAGAHINHLMIEVSEVTSTSVWRISHLRDEGSGPTATKGNSHVRDAAHQLRRPVLGQP